MRKIASNCHLQIFRFILFKENVTWRTYLISCTVRYFRLFRNYIFLCAAKISSCNILSFLFTSFFVPIRWYLKPLKGEIKKKRLRSSAGSLFLVPFFSPARAGGSTAKQRYPKLGQVSLLADQFIVYLAIVVTYSYSFTTFQTAYFWSSLGNCVEY